MAKGTELLVVKKKIQESPGGLEVKDSVLSLSWLGLLLWFNEIIIGLQVGRCGFKYHFYPF